MKKILSLVAVAAIAYGVVSVAAASLTVTANDPLPQAGADTSVAGGCASGASVAYTVTSGQVDGIVVTVTENASGDCAGLDVSATMTGENGLSTTAQAFDADGNTFAISPAIDIADFAPTAFSVAVY